MPSYELLTSGDEVTKIVNTPMKARFPKGEILSLIGIFVGFGILCVIWTPALILVGVLAPVWLMLILGLFIFPLGWLIASMVNQGKGQTELTLSDGKLKVVNKNKEILNIDIDQISSIRIGNKHEKVDGYSALQKMYGVHRWAETMYYLEARFQGKTQIIAWGLDSPSAEGLLHEIGFSTPA
jgi:hypothetical protein